MYTISRYRTSLMCYIGIRTYLVVITFLRITRVTYKLFCLYSAVCIVHVITINYLSVIVDAHTPSYNC